MKKKITIIVTVPLSIETWLKGQPRYLKDYYDIELITSSGTNIEELKSYEQVPITLFDFTRQINPIKDLKILLSLWRHFRTTKPDMVYSITPKAGLLGMMAAWLARVPIRLHLIVGLVYFGSFGKKRFLLKTIEKMTYFFATHLYANSLNLVQIIKQELTSKKVNVIGYGSVNGVNTADFNNTFSPEEISALRHSLNIPTEAFLLLYTGRIVSDKGVNELVTAFTALADEHTALHLLLVGDYERNLDPIKPDTYELIFNHPRIRHISFQRDIRPYFCISDLLILPSYREGLPNVLIEGGSCSLPLIATDINGCNEVIMNGENGLLVTPKSVQALIEAIEALLKDSSLYAHLKANARESIVRRYDQNLYWTKLHNELDALFSQEDIQHV